VHFDLEAAIARLKGDFIDNSLDKLDEIDNIINAIYSNCENRGEKFFQLQRDVHSIKGSAGTHGLHLLTLVAHRLEDYIEASSRLTQEQWRSVQEYVDVMRKLLNTGIEPTENERTKILQSLPHAQQKSDAAFSEQKKKRVTILIVMPPGVQRKAMGRELASCGFDLSFTDRPVEAIRLVMDLQPDAVISDHNFRNMTGSELANVLQDIKITQHIPFALLDGGSAAGADIPESTRIIHKDSKFADDLTEYLVDIGLFGQL